MYSIRGRSRNGQTIFKNSESINSSPSDFHNLPPAENSKFVHTYCCTSINVDLEMDSNTFSKFTELKELWLLVKKSPQLSKKLNEFFNECSNPFVDVIKFMNACREFNVAKSKSLSHIIIEELKFWCVKQETDLNQLMSFQLQLDALKMGLKQRCSSLLKMTIEVYNMADNGSLFIKKILCLSENKDYREACLCSIFIKIKDQFSVEDFIVPLILQDKISELDQYLHNNPVKQQELVKFFDEFLESPFIKDKLCSYAIAKHIPDVKLDKFHAKPIKKLLGRLLKTYKIPSTLTPNLNKRRNEGTLQFLMHRRYVQNDLGEESWRELAEEAVGNDINLQMELINCVATFGSYEDTLRWTTHFKIPKNEWPNKLLYPEKIDLIAEDQSTQLIRSSLNVEYYQSQLSFEKIIVIDNIDQFNNFIESIIINKVNVVGIDCEWKPIFNNEEKKLALMQIATKENVFILDVIALINYTNLWKQLANELFYNNDIIKLGFDFSSDFIIINNTFPTIDFIDNKAGFLDLYILWKQIDTYKTFKFPYEGKSNGFSFSILVEKCFGRPLDKSDRFSNWENRPLRKSQLIYASLDAYCLIEVYYVIKSVCKKASLPFDEICNNIVLHGKSFKKKLTSLTKMPSSSSSSRPVVNNKPQPPYPYSGSLKSTNIKFVCDIKLNELGKRLITYDIDVLILENNKNCMECVYYAQKDNRFILASGSTFDKVCDYVPSGHCLRIMEGSVDEQIQYVMKYFKITINNIISDCKFCNGCNIITVPYKRMLLLRKLQFNTESIYEKEYENDFSFVVNDELNYDSFDSLGACGGLDENDDIFDPPINMELDITKNGVSIEFSMVPENVFNNVEIFYVCYDCGKIYWNDDKLQ